MKKYTILVMVTALMGILLPVNAVSRSRERNRTEVLTRGRGYYKDVFMDGGLYLTSRRTLPATDFLGLSLEFFASNKNKELTQQDTLVQTNIFCGSKEDTNGWLLYPDGAPRYRMIYVNGGKAGQHAKSLTARGQEQMRKYVDAGGGYVGTCAGAYLASNGTIGRDGNINNADVYYGLCPHLVYATRLIKSKTDMSVERKSPLLRYFDFGGDKIVEAVRHNGGCYAKDEDFKAVSGVIEPLTRYIFADTKKVKIDGKISSWAFKKDKQSGRVVSCGSHPEGVKEGERLEYMASMMLYAMDGNPVPKVKGELRSGEVREMNKRTEDNSSAYTRIGDKQYHHFELDIPKRCKQAVVTLEGYEGEDNFDLLLCAKMGEWAFSDNATRKSSDKGCSKNLIIEKPKAGKWYISVLCNTTVTASTGKFGTEYSGRTDVLNGVPYKISVKYE